MPGDGPRFDPQDPAIQHWAARTPQFSEITKKLQRGAHTSVQALNADIRDWIKNLERRPRPCVGTKTSGQILESIARYCKWINDSSH